MIKKVQPRLLNNGTLNLSAKIDGYSAAIGYPICQRKEIVQFCREAHTWSEKQVKTGVYAAR